MGHPSVESEGWNFNFLWGLRLFFVLCLWQVRKKFFYGVCNDIFHSLPILSFSVCDWIMYKLNSNWRGSWKMSKVTSDILHNSPPKLSCIYCGDWGRRIFCLSNLLALHSTHFQFATSPVFDAHVMFGFLTIFLSGFYKWSSVPHKTSADPQRADCSFWCRFCCQGNVAGLQ